MITKINNLKSSTDNKDVKALCESSITALSSIIYNNVTPEARYEIEHVTLENLFTELSKHNTDKTVNEWLTNQQRMYYIKNIGVRDSINRLLVSEGKHHSTLNGILNLYKERLEEEVPEVMLYESFVSAASGFSYLPAVNTELETIHDRTKKYALDIDIEKIVETMKETKSNYLIPLIEDAVNNYLSNKTEQSKHMLKETLVKFSYDPFIRDIINVLILDATDLQLEYANESVKIDRVYSPLVYLGENECLFNIKNSYYIKKGHNINKVKREDVVLLNRGFATLCESLNSPNIVIDKDTINLYMGADKAQVTKDGVKVNEQMMDVAQLKDAADVSRWTGNTQFYTLTEMLRDNFDEIAEVDFAKRVSLKEDENYAADIFKLRDNIFITTFDSVNNKNTFYRNINPIQAEKIMMEHMRFDITRTFADILPNKEKILAQINETKREYSDYIILLEKKMDEFKLISHNQDINGAVIETLQEEYDAVKNEYKDYLNEVERYVRPSGDTVDESISISLNIDGKKYEVPIPQEVSTAKGETSADQQSTETGTEVGAENTATDQEPASAVTFDDNTELLGDSPSMDSDKVDLGAEDTAEEVDDLEKEKQEKEKLMDPNAATTEPSTDGTEQPAGEETSSEGGASTEEKPEGEQGGETFDIGGEGSEESPEESDELNVSDTDEEPKEEETEEDKKKKKKTEESLQRTSYVKEKEETKKPMKVYLKKKKS